MIKLVSVILNAMKKFTLLLLCSFVLMAFADSTVKSPARQSPQVYNAKFETTKGDFTINIQRKWSPKAADRFYDLINSGYFNNIAFYRVVPDFVAQFGSTDPVALKKWSEKIVPDEEVLLSNKKGTISFARLEKDSRGTDLFINLKDNTRLDTLDYNGVKGFPAFGNVTSGMHVVEKLYSGYEDTTMENEHMYTNPELFIKAFPKLDSIKKAYIIR